MQLLKNHGIIALSAFAGMVLFFMHKFRQVAGKLVTFIALLSVLTQSLSPYIYALPRVAYAQEVQEETITPTPIESGQAQEVTPAPSEEPTVTPDPTIEVTPAVEPTNEPIVTPQENQENNNSPPAGGPRTKN